MIETIITSSILIISIILIRRLCRGKISAGMQYALWLIVALRLIVPSVTVVFPNLLPESAFSIMNIAEKVGTNAQDYIQEPVNIGQINVPFGKLPFVNVANDGPTAVFYAGQIGWTWLDFFKGIWYAGIAVAGVWMAAVNILFMRRLLANRTKYEKEDYKLSIYYIKDLASPCLYGIPGKQAVYLPEEVIEDEERVKHILAHEYCHYKHRDVLWAGLRCILLAVYWFNPLVWLAAVLSKRDCELACDEAAIRMLGEEERIAYGKTLLSLITKAPKASDIVCAATTMTGTGKSVKERIKRIAQKPKRLAIILLPVLAAVGAIVAFTFTQAKEYPEGAFLLEGEGEQLVTSDCFQINFPETIAKEVYCVIENDTDVIIYHKDDKREIGSFRRLIYEEAAALSDEREVVPIGNYGKNWMLRFHMNGRDDSEGDIDENSVTVHYEPYDENADGTGGVVGTDSNADSTYIDDVQYEEKHDYLPNENITATDINDGSNSVVDHVYTPNENIETGDASDTQHSESSYSFYDENISDSTPHEESHDYLPNEIITTTDTNDASSKVDHVYTPSENIHDEDSYNIMLPDEKVTTVNMLAYQYCYIYVPADNSDAEESVQNKLAELNRKLIDLSDSVTILFVSMDSMEEILDILVTHRSDISNLSNISEIAQTIPVAEGLSYSMTGFTDSEPDTITLYYRLLSDDIAKIDKDTLFVDAVLMFSLIEDLETCSFQISEDSDKIKYSAVTPEDYQASTVNYNYERSEMEELFGELYPCSETKGTFVDLYNRVVEYLGQQE